MAASPESPQTAEFLARLQAALERLPVPQPAPRYAVALSGGIDSMVLLAALRRLVAESRLVAWHIDHGLDAQSSRWTEHCARAAAALGVAFQSRRVEVPRGPEHGGLEAAARTARYAALATLMATGDVLLTAHHGDDQLETLRCGCSAGQASAG
jgi:tRNA(Ile)-lysidine synthase